MIQVSVACQLDSKRWRWQQQLGWHGSLRCTAAANNPVWHLYVQRERSALRDAPHPQPREQAGGHARSDEHIAVRRWQAETAGVGDIPER